MNVLVTGSKGYIGKSIINSKIKGINFIEGHRNNINLFDKNCIKEFIEFNKIDSIIHCAIEGGSRLKNDDSNIFYNNLLIFDENEIETRFIKTCILKSLKNEPITIHEDKIMDFFYLKDLIPVIENILLNESLYKDINLSYPIKYKLSEIAKNISLINKSKSKIIIQKNSDLNYNGNYNKFISLPIKTQGLDKGILATISKLQ